MVRSTRHPHYSTPEAFERLSLEVLRAIVRYHFSRLNSDQQRAPGWHIPEGQYLVLHRVQGREGEYYIPLLVHVRKGYSGPEAYVHPIPLRKEVAEALKIRGVHTPYGIAALEALESALSAKDHYVPEKLTHDYVVNRISTRRARRQYPPLPEYLDGYIANKLLQEVAPETGKFKLRDGAVFVLEYHVRNGTTEAHLQPFRREVHSPVSLKTVWPEDFHPVAHASPDVFRNIHNEVREEWVKSRHFRPRIRE